MSQLSRPAHLGQCTNWVRGEPHAASGQERALVSPYFGAPLAAYRESTDADVAHAVQSAGQSFGEWSQTPLRERLAVLERFGALLRRDINDLSRGVALESGKTPAEAAAGIERGLEVIDFAKSLQNLDLGGARDVSRGVVCEYRREPLGVVVGITPFNFPAMVPLWMLPLAVATGNCFILKPSDKAAVTACRLAALSAEAGFPPGVVSVVQGGAETVQALVRHDAVRAVAFVGSTKVAGSVYALAAQHGKRALCLGGAKNHLIAAPDADPELTVRAVVDSFTGCAGQRCMAGSVLVTVGSARRIISHIVERCRAIELGSDMGALIDSAARARLVQAIELAEQQGAKVLLDGRQARPANSDFAEGFWLGPTILGAVTPGMDSAERELFGPLLSIIEVDTVEQALALESQSPYGNATSIFTASGATARLVSERSTSGMVGVNIGVPVPRDPFSFGGAKASRFGHGDITGAQGVDFWTQLKKVTTKWATQSDANWMS